MKPFCQSLKIKKTKKRPAWVSDFKAKAFSHYLETPIPHSKTEEWKYFNPNFIFNRYFEPNPSTDLIQVSQTPGIICQPFSHNWESVHPFLRSIDATASFFKQINHFSFEDGLLLKIPENKHIQAPVMIRITPPVNDTPQISHPKLFIQVQPHAQATIWIQYEGDGSYCLNSVSEIVLQENAELELIISHKGGLDSIHLDSTAVSLHQNSRFNGLLFSHSNALVKHNIELNINESGVDCTLNGLSILNDSGKVYTQTVVNHHQPHSQSRQLFKNILLGQSIAEYTGLVHVFPHAIKTQSNQLTQTLVLSEKSKSYSRPQLIIQTDDVQCTHGSTSGQLVDSELFYLQSRGLSPAQAADLLIYGFAAAVIQSIKNPVLFQTLKQMIEEITR